MRANKAVLKALTRTHGRPVDRESLLRAVAERGIPADAALKALGQLVDTGRVTALDGQRYLAVAGRNLVIGKISVHRRGFGFVEAPGGDVYVKSTDMRGALHGDTVAVRLTGGGERGAAGVVAHVVERGATNVVGRFEIEGRVGVVTPSDRRLRTDVFVPLPEAKGAERGDVVVARITRYPTSRDAAQGVVEEVVGPEGSPGVDIEIIIREHGLRTEFPAAVLAEADAIPEGYGADVPAESVGEGESAEGGEGLERVDLGDLYTITIDPVDAKDFDDAVSVAREGSGWRLWVHIADVSHYVPWGSAVDEEARRRATSVYLVDRVLPMLPERLSNGICSLKPGLERLTMTTEIALDRTGLVESYRLYPSVIRSDRRLDYDRVDEWLAAGQGFPDAASEALLVDFRDLAAKLAERRARRGGLDFETVEAKVILDETGAPVDVAIRQRTVATNMIEEAMILANEVVAGHMVSHEAPMVFRIHEDPDEDALAQIAVVLAEFDYPITNIGSARPATFQRIVEYAHGRPEQLLINSLLLRALKRARYVDFPHSHFGLASDAYTHFTSPIRRYPDLLVHRLLKAQLAGTLRDEPVASIEPELQWLAEHSSLMEREAETAEDDSTKLKLTELMADHVGEEFDGIITGVTPFGFFVQLSNTAEGLVHVEALLDDYYRYDAERFWLKGDERGRTYRLGQEVRVRIVDTSVSERRIEFELA
jgi:ribonuclease R